MTENVDVKMTVDTGQATQSTNNYKKTLRELKEQMVDLQVSTNGLADATEEQRAQYAALEQQAGKISDALGDVSARVNANADDFQGMSAAMEGLQGGIGALQGVVGATELLGLNSEGIEKTVRTMMGLQAVMSSINAVQKVMNKDSKLRVAIDKLLTAGLIKNKTATVGAASATAVFATGEGVATTASFTLAGACKAVGAAIKSIPVIGWILAAISALATLISLIVACNDEEDEGVKIQKEKEANQQSINEAYIEGARAVAKETRELNNSLTELKNCKKGTDEWTQAAGDVARTLGVSVDWIENNELAVDDLAEAWLRVKKVQATQDALLKNMAENDVKLAQLEIAKAELLAASVDTRRSVAEKWAKTFGWSEDQVDELVDAVNKSKDKNQYKYKHAIGRIDAVINTSKKSITDANKELEKSYDDLGKSIKEDTEKIENAGKAAAKAAEDAEKAKAKEAKAKKDAEDAKAKKDAEDAKAAKELEKLNSELDKYNKKYQTYFDQTNSNIEESNKETYEGRMDNLRREHAQTIGTLDEELVAYKNYYNSLTDEQKAALGDRLISIEQFEQAQDLLRNQALDTFVASVNEENEIEAKSNKKKERDAIDTQNRIDDAILNTKLANTKEGSEEYFELQVDIENERYEQEKEELKRRFEDGQITKAEFDAISEEQEAEHQKRLSDINNKAEQQRLDATRERIETVGSYMQMASNFVSALEEAELAEYEGNEKKQKEIKKKYAVAKALTDIAQIGVQTALGIMSVWPAVAPLGPIAGPILGAILSALIAGTGIAQTIKATQEVAKIKQAKYGAFVVGPSHSEGGVQYELEGGEVVLNKQAMAIPEYRAMASAMNVSTGGVAFPNTRASNAAITASIDASVIDRIVKKIAAIPVVVSEGDITSSIRNVSVLEGHSRI